MPVHVVLLPLVPVTALWAGNAEGVHNRMPLLLCGILLLVALALTGTATVVQRDLRRSTLVLSPMLMAATGFGYVFRGPDWHAAGLVVVAISGVALSVAAARVGDRAAHHTTLFLNVVGLALVGTNVLQVLTGAPTSASQGGAPPISVAAHVEGAPDIWYIAPDRLPDLDVLREAGVDTRPLEEALESRGFTLADETWSNYPSTQTSLASAWSLSHLDPSASTTIGSQAAAILADPPLGRTLKEAGYRYVHIGTWLDATSTSASADAVLTLQGAGEFYDAFERASVIPALRRVLDIGVPGFASIEERQVLHARHQFDVLEQLASLPESDQPLFVLSHITLPHPPYVFRADGSTRSHLLPAAERRRAYEEQLDYFTHELLDLLDRLLARPSPPVVLVMADEGVYPEDLAPIPRPPLHAGSLTDKQLREKMSITAALHAPAELIPPEDIARARSPLEVVSLVLSTALGRRVPVTDPGVNYWAPPGESPRLVDVSDRVGATSSSSAGTEVG